MEPQILIHRKKISAFCSKWKIKELYLFGSALRDDFSPESDVDVLVEFHDSAEWDLFDWIDIQDGLSEIFGQKVDLTSAKGLRNPIIREEIAKTRRLIYAG